MTATEIIRADHNQGDSSNFLYLLEKIKKLSSPNCNKIAVYLLLKESPIAIPPRMKNHFLSSKIALYKQSKLRVQKSKSGTSGVELKESIEMKIVETTRMTARCTFFFDKKQDANA
nr:hypothetical protein [uncultured bacterium]